MEESRKMRENIIRYALAGLLSLGAACSDARDVTRQRMPEASGYDVRVEYIHSGEASPAAIRIGVMEKDGRNYLEQVWGKDMDGDGRVESVHISSWDIPNNLRDLASIDEVSRILTVVNSQRY